MNKLVQGLIAIAMIVIIITSYPKLKQMYSEHKLKKAIVETVVFQKEKEKRYTETKEKLEKILKAQLAFKDAHGKFTENWDSLIYFIKKDTLKFISRIGLLTDSMIEAGWTEKIAIEKGRIIRDTIRVSVLDTLFGYDYPIDDLEFIPLVEKDTAARFELRRNEIYQNGNTVTALEINAHNNTILKGLDRIDIINLNDKMRMGMTYPGLTINLLPDNSAIKSWGN